MTLGAWGKRGRPLKPKEGLNGPPKTLIAGVASFVIHLSTRLRESAARDDKGKGEASMESGCEQRVPFLRRESLKGLEAGEAASALDWRWHDTYP